jgi:hypothetical protein
LADGRRVARVGPSEIVCICQRKNPLGKVFFLVRVKIKGKIGESKKGRPEVAPMSTSTNDHFNNIRPAVRDSATFGLGHLRPR